MVSQKRKSKNSIAKRVTLLIKAVKMLQWKDFKSISSRKKSLLTIQTLEEAIMEILTLPDFQLGSPVVLYPQDTFTSK